MTSSPQLDVATDQGAVSAESSRSAESPPSREVVVGADGSTTGLAAVRWAAHEAAARGAPLRIVHAATYLCEPPAPGAAPPELPRARSILATAYTAARHAEPGMQVSTELVPDSPVATLLHACSDADLLVLGISTTGAADELVLASLTQRVAARSTQPVAVVPRTRSDGHRPGRADSAKERPVVAVRGLGDDGDDHAVISFAAAAARRTGRPLSVVDLRPGAAPADDDWAQELGDLEVNTTALPGADGVSLLRSVGPAPLLVLATGHTARFHRALDRRHRWLLRHCTCPMALVPPSAA
jgi:nucleotide-binding universal stress UspA family protein